MMRAELEMRHLDLSVAAHDEHEYTAGAFIVLWWRHMPLMAAVFDRAELPLGEGTLSFLLSRCAAAQRLARDRSLSGPPQAGPSGEPAAEVLLSNVLAVNETVQWLDKETAAIDQEASSLSVVVCTRDRLHSLEACLTSLSNLRLAPGQITVVDNSSGGSARALCGKYAGLTYIHEPRQGLSRARNAGLAVSVGQYIAFTDDDVVLPPEWSSEVVRAFETSGADALTGLVLPLRLATEAQSAFQLDMGGFGTRFEPLEFQKGFIAGASRMCPPVWKIGAGANMAFRRSVFDAIGSFDERLGAGASGCSEDSELWYRILAAGRRCFYEPRVVVFHDHRSEMSALHNQVRAYMKGHVSALVAQADRYGHNSNIKRILFHIPRYFLNVSLALILRPRRTRFELLLSEMSGWLSGLQYLFRMGWRRQERK